MGAQLRALIIEDSPSDALLLLRELKRAGRIVDHVRVDTAEDMIAALESATWDVILSDFSMPHFSATAALKLVKERGIDLPFIIVSGTMGEETAVAAMKAGAHDYFPKGRTTRLVSAIEREVREAQEREQRRKAESELRQAEERFAKAFQVSPIGITINNSQAIFLTVNDSFRLMLGFTSESIVGRTPLEIGIWQDPTDQKLLESFSGEYKSLRDRDLVLQTQSGEIRNVSVSTETIDLGGETCVLAMWQDITERKRAEDALKKHIELTELLRDVTTAANEATEVNTALQIAMTYICRFAGWSLGHSYMRTRGDPPQLTPSQLWHISDLENFDNFRDASYRGQLAVATGNLAYQVFASGTPVWIANVQYVSDTNQFNEAQRAGIKSVYAVPIFAHHEVTAVMEFFSTVGVGLDQSFLNTIPDIATRVGHVIERVMSNDEIRALYDATAYLFNAEGVQSLAQQIVQGVVDEFEHVDCGLLLVNKQTGQINRLARAGRNRISVDTALTIDGPGLVPKAIRDGNVVYAPNVQHDEHYVPNVPSTQSEIVVPLRIRDETIGVLDLQSSQRNYFSQSDQRVLLAFAERAAAALENIRLYEEINRHAAQLELRVEERTHELQEAKERVETILHNSSDAIILLNKNGIIQQTNPRFEELFGYKSDELFAEDLSRIISTENTDDLFRIMRAITVDREYVRLEVLAHRKDGSVFPSDAAFAAFARNHETGIVCSLRDISEHKKLEQELRSAFERQKELAELKTRFISTVAHEYRTPLAIIHTSTDLLISYNDRLNHNEKLRHLEKIQAQVNRLTALLNDVLEIGRAESVGMDLNPEEVDITVLCREVVTDIGQVYPDYPIEFRVAGEISPVTVDVRLMRQIISNLVSNALKYSPNQRVVQIFLTFANEKVILSVKDEGIGIPEEELDDLFTTFHRARNVGQIQGTGLGLVIVKKAVEAHGGTISVESKINQGTTFTVALPL